MKRYNPDSYKTISGFNTLVWFFLFVLILAFLWCPNSYAEDFEIKHADLLEADKNKINIKGNIIINYKEATIKASDGVIETSNEGNPDTAIFFNRPVIQLKDRYLEADKITVHIKDKKIIAEGNSNSSLVDKKNNTIMISSDYQELLWSGEGANAKGNIQTSYQETLVTSEECKIIYKNKKPNQAVFLGSTKEKAKLEQPTNKILAKEIQFDIATNNILANGDVDITIWPDQKTPKEEQDTISFNSGNLLIDQKSGLTIAKSDKNLVKVSYQETKGESQEALLIKNKDTGKPEKIIFKGKANVTQPDKQLSSEEIVFDFKDKKLISSTKTNVRPKTLIFKGKDNNLYN